VSGEPQRRALLDGIAALDRGGVVTTDVRTFAEAARGSPPPDRRVHVLESAVGAAPIEAYLRTRVPEADTASLVRELTPRVLAATGRVRRHALALKAVAERFGEGARERFDGPARAAWSALVQRQVAGCAAALDELDAALAPYFDPAGDVPGAGSGDLATTIDRLVQEAATVNEIVAALLVAPGPTPGGPVQSFPDDLRQHIHHARFDVRAIGSFAQP
jgi:hypothetical protein